MTFGALKTFTMKACVEFYCRQIAEKILSKIPAVHQPRRAGTDQFVVVLVRIRVPSAFVHLADSTSHLANLLRWRPSKTSSSKFRSSLK